jgi:uncharacterized OB-fold protein
MDYTYVAGTGRTIFLNGLSGRKFLARRCPGCDQVYLPPPEFCSRCLAELSEPFEAAPRGLIQTFCIINFRFPGQTIDPPYVVAYIQHHGTDTRLMHLVRDIDPGEVRIGLEVEPVWSSTPAASMTSILHYRPAHA